MPNRYVLEAMENDLRSIKRKVPVGSKQEVAEALAKKERAIKTAQERIDNYKRGEW